MHVYTYIGIYNKYEWNQLYNRTYCMGGNGRGCGNNNEQGVCDLKWQLKVTQNETPDSWSWNKNIAHDWDESSFRYIWGYEQGWVSGIINESTTLTYLR